MNKLSIIFQQKDQCEIWWKLAKWFLKNHDFIQVNSTVAGKYYKYKPDDGHLRFPIRTILTTVDLKVTSILFDLGLTSLSTFFSHIATVSGCGRELNAHF